MAASEARAIIAGLRVASEGIALWNEYNRDLLMLQTQRAAEGRTVTMAEVQTMLEATHLKIQGNKARLAELAAMQDAAATGG